MRRVLLATLIAAASLVVAASPVAAQVEYQTLEQRVAASDLVVTGEVAKVDAEAKIEKAPGMTAVTITVAQVLKGPADLKELTMLWQPEAAKPPATPAETPPNGEAPGETPADAPPPDETPPVTYEAGQEHIWFLKKHPAGETMVVDAAPQQIEPVESAATVSAVVTGLKAPETVLAEGKDSPRSRLAAAYALLERMVPESRLPLAEGKPDTTGARAIDAAVITAAGTAAVEFFGSTTANDRLPAEAVLKRLGCPTASLAPQPAQPKPRRTAEEVLRDISAHRAAWGRNVATWLGTNLQATRFYEPAKGVALRTAGAATGGARPAKPVEPAAKTAAATVKVGDMKIGLWADLFSEADWNKFADRDIREYRGTLIAATASQRNNLYRLKMADTTWDVYTAGSNVLQPYVGREVTLRGKYVLLILETRTSREIWPTAIRLEK